MSDHPMEDAAAAGYDAWRDSMAGTTGVPAPAWLSLPAHIRDAWCAAAEELVQWSSADDE